MPGWPGPRGAGSRPSSSSAGGSARTSPASRPPCATTCPTRSSSPRTPSCGSCTAWLSGSRSPSISSPSHCWIGAATARRYPVGWRRDGPTDTSGEPKEFTVGTHLVKEARGSVKAWLFGVEGRLEAGHDQNVTFSVEESITMALLLRAAMRAQGRIADPWHQGAKEYAEVVAPGQFSHPEAPRPPVLK